MSTLAQGGPSRGKSACQWSVNVMFLLTRSQGHNIIPNNTERCALARPWKCCDHELMNCHAGWLVSKHPDVKQNQLRMETKWHKKYLTSSHISNCSHKVGKWVLCPPVRSRAGASNCKIRAPPAARTTFRSFFPWSWQVWFRAKVFATAGGTLILLCSFRWVLQSKSPPAVFFEVGKWIRAKVPPTAGGTLILLCSLLWVLQNKGAACSQNQISSFFHLACELEQKCFPLIDGEIDNRCSAANLYKTSFFHGRMLLRGY